LEAAFCLVGFRDVERAGCGGLGQVVCAWLAVVNVGCYCDADGLVLVVEVVSYSLWESSASVM
jgi:hypothetical protein